VFVIELLEHVDFVVEPINSLAIESFEYFDGAFVAHSSFSNSFKYNTVAAFASPEHSANIKSGAIRRFESVT